MEDMSELTAEEQAKLLRHELEAVYGSSSYKIGRAVTWLPRNAKPRAVLVTKAEWEERKLGGQYDE